MSTNITTPGRAAHFSAISNQSKSGVQRPDLVGEGGRAAPGAFRCAQIFFNKSMALSVLPVYLHPLQTEAKTTAGEVGEWLKPVVC
jgi:hypothetical protein